MWDTAFLNQIEHIEHHEEMRHFLLYKLLYKRSSHIPLHILLLFPLQIPRLRGSVLPREQVRQCEWHQRSVAVFAHACYRERWNWENEISWKEHVYLCLFLKEGCRQ